MPNALLCWISNLFWPVSCLGCGRSDVRLCRTCLDALPPVPPPAHAGDIVVIAAGMMRSRLLKRAVWYLKYRNAQNLAAPLGDLVAAAVGHACIAADMVIPIPLHAGRLRVRGYNQAELLAERLAAIATLPCLSDTLVRVQKTVSQVDTRSRRERMTNVTDAFTVTCPESVRTKRILLVDDVSTTGSTLDAAGRVLYRAGAARVTGVVVARG